MPSLPQDDDERFTPAQQRTVDILGADASGRPEFDRALGLRLHDELVEGLEPLLDGLPEDTNLWIAKHALATVHGCEAAFVAQGDERFEWTLANAVGKVVHKAIELSITWRNELIPLDLVDDAFASLLNDSSGFGEFLQGLTEAEEAELLGVANSRVSAFFETFPPLDRKWRPVAESSVRVELFDGRIILSGRVDLTIGTPRGNRAGKVLIDLKTGGTAPAHTEDLRFYALLETIKLSVPPRLLASFYLDSGKPIPEPVTEEMLDAALQRTIDGATRIVELRHHDHPPVKRPGRPCRWCPIAADCDEGQAYLAAERTD